MNTKAIIASTLLSAIFAGTSAIAGDNDYLKTVVDTTTEQPFVIKHAYLLTTTEDSKQTEEVSSK